MSNSKVLILGATSDVGVALAKEYAVHKFHLILAARNIEDLKPIKSDLEIRYEVLVDIVSFDAVYYGTHGKFLEEIGLPEVVINVFGYLGDQSIAENDWAEAEKIITTNYLGAVSILEVVASKMIEKGNGTIVGISSVAGERGRLSNYFYGSSKAGFTAYLSGLRNRLFHFGIHVVTVKPGFIDTKMTAGMELPKLLTAKPEQVARSIFKAVRRKRNTVYIFPIWRLIMYVIKSLPEGIFKKLKL